MTPTIVFDVNETLLDLAPVRYWFRGRFDDGPDATSWFSELLRLSFVSSVTNRYVPFTDLAAAALETVALKCGITITEEDAAQVRGLFVRLPPHPDVPEGLSILTDAGFRVAALTNSPLATARTQLANAGIAGSFNTVMSVDMANRFKPHRSVYVAAADHLNMAVSDMVMVAAHDWDIAGAMAAGLDGVFVSRPGQTYSTAMAPPTLTAPNIPTAARLITARY